MSDTDRSQEPQSSDPGSSEEQMEGPLDAEYLEGFLLSSIQSFEEQTDLSVKELYLDTECLRGGGTRVTAVRVMVDRH